MSGTHVGPYTNHSDYVYPLPTTTEKKPSLHDKNTDWDVFRELLETHINLKIPLQTHINLKIPLQKEAKLEDPVYNLTTIQQAAWNATPPLREQHTHQDCPELVKHKLREKRAARKTWHK